MQVASQLRPAHHDVSADAISLAFRSVFGMPTRQESLGNRLEATFPVTRGRSSRPLAVGRRPVGRGGRGGRGGRIKSEKQDPSGIYPEHPLTAPPTLGKIPYVAWQRKEAARQCLKPLTQV